MGPESRNIEAREQPAHHSNQPSPASARVRPRPTMANMANWAVSNKFWDGFKEQITRAAYGPGDRAALQSLASEIASEIADVIAAGELPATLGDPTEAFNSGVQLRSSSRAFSCMFFDAKSVAEHVLCGHRAENALAARIYDGIDAIGVETAAAVAALEAEGLPCDFLKSRLAELIAPDDCWSGDRCPRLWNNIATIVLEAIGPNDSFWDRMYAKDGFPRLAVRAEWEKTPVECLMMLANFSSATHGGTRTATARRISAGVHDIIGWGSPSPAMARQFVAAMVSWGPRAKVFDLGAGRGALGHLLPACARALGVAHEMPEILAYDDFSEEASAKLGRVERRSAGEAMASALEASERTGEKVYVIASWAREEIYDAILGAKEALGGLLLLQNSAGEGGYNNGYGLKKGKRDPTLLRPLYRRMEERLDKDGNCLGAPGHGDNWNYARVFVASI